MSVMDILNPGTIVRSYCVSVGTWNHGWEYYYWLKSSAIKRAKKECESWPYVTLKNEWTGNQIVLKNTLKTTHANEPT